LLQGGYRSANLPVVIAFVLVSAMAESRSSPPNPALISRPTHRQQFYLSLWNLGARFMVSPAHGAPEHLSSPGLFETVGPAISHLIVIIWIRRVRRLRQTSEFWRFTSLGSGYRGGIVVGPITSCQ
jgi:hypothetical protein